MVNPIVSILGVATIVMKILVIGASARAAAQSIRRAGMEVAALDLFVDRDLRAIAECEAIRLYPESIVSQAIRWQNHAVMLCGGMENHPEVISELEKRHTLIGPTASQIVSLRDLDCWKSWVAEFGNDTWLRFPDTLDNDRVVAEGELGASWLAKSYRGAGGTHVRRFRAGESYDPHTNYLQRFESGMVLGITFRCLSEATVVIGGTQNLSASELHSEGFVIAPELPFLYYGSIGPVCVPQALETKLAAWMGKIANSIHYRGILQADFVASQDGRLYLLEINPRWTASMEVLEMCSSMNLVQEQLKTQFQVKAGNAIPPSTRESKTEAIKLVVYANRQQMISQQISDEMMNSSNWQASQHIDAQGSTGWSDIPEAGTLIEAGAPIATAWGLRSKGLETQPIKEWMTQEMQNFSRFLG